jgi:Cofactor assembly of complex C subunit B
VDCGSFDSKNKQYDNLKMMKKLLLPLLLTVSTVSHGFLVRPAPLILQKQQQYSRSSLNMVPIDELVTTSLVSNPLDTVSTSLLLLSADLSGPPESGGITYSKLSYYAVLGLYLMSFPGLWSIVKRSTSAKVKRKTYINPGEKSGDVKAKGLRQQAGEIMACKCANFILYITDKKNL